MGVLAPQLPHSYQHAVEILQDRQDEAAMFAIAERLSAQPIVPPDHAPSTSAPASAPAILQKHPKKNLHHAPQPSLRQVQV
jgi:hypothetical protein